jgi:hypothetical protein
LQYGKERFHEYSSYEGARHFPEKYGHRRQIRKPQNRLGGLFLLLGDCRHELRFRIFRCSHQSGGIPCRYCSELADVESTKYRIIAEGRTYNITYVNPMGYKHNSLKFNCKLEKNA